jgi:hypothetical protein
MLDTIFTFFNDFIFIFTDLIPVFLADAVTYIGKLMVYAGLYIKLNTMALSFDIAGSILNDLDISSHIQDSFSYVDSQTLMIANYFKIPNFIELILTAYTTRFVMGFL